MRRLLILLALGLLVLNVPGGYAQDEAAPILALDAGGIYAVSPIDGSAETLVEPPADYEAMHGATFDPVTLFSAEWLSPDGQYLAYRTLSPDEQVQLSGVGTLYAHRLFLLDLQNGGDPIPVSLADTDAAETYSHVESLAWSIDGLRLYVAISTFDPEEGESSGWSLAIIERDSWEELTVVPLEAPGYAMARRIFAVEDGVVVFDQGIQSPLYEFTMFDTEGEDVGQLEVDSSQSPDVNLYVNTPFNPLENEDAVTFGLVRQQSGEIAFQVDFAASEVTPVDSGYLTGLISRLASDTSLRLSPGLFSGDDMALQIRDAENNYVGDISYVRAYAFGIRGDNDGSTFALSPDGQTLAYLEDGSLMLWQDGEVTALDLNAEALAWSPVMYVPVYDPAYFAG